MTRNDELFEAAAATLRVPGMGTEVVAPMLADLVRFVRPRRVLEVGMGYTTLFLAHALADVRDRQVNEAARLAAKSRDYLETATPLDRIWLTAEPALARPVAYSSPWLPVFVAIDDLSLAESSAPRVSAALDSIGLGGDVTIVSGDLRTAGDRLPADLLPIDLAWIDAWECLYFLEHYWDAVNPDGGIIAMHYLAGYPEGEAILEYLATWQRQAPGTIEILTLVAPHLLAQNSITILRRRSLEPNLIAGRGGEIDFASLRSDLG